jgi:hypothetical protein
MQRVIWKFPLKVKDGLQVLVVNGVDVKPLCVQMQNGVPTVWVELTPVDGGPSLELHAMVVGTGHKFDPLGRYLGTVQDTEYPLVWHIYIS